MTQISYEYAYVEPMSGRVWRDWWRRPWHSWQTV